MNTPTSSISLTNLITDVCRYLPAFMLYGVRTSNSVLIAREDGLIISFVTTSGYAKPGTMVAGYEYAKDDHGDTWKVSSLDHPAINITMSRGPKAIAADLNKRLIPEAHQYHEAAKKLVAASNEAIKGKTLTLDSLTGFLKIPTRDAKDDRSYNIDLPRIGSARGDLRIHTADSIEINLRYLTQPQTVRLLNLIKELATETPAT